MLARLGRQKALPSLLRTTLDEAVRRSVPGETSGSCASAAADAPFWHICRQFAKAAVDSGLKAYKPTTPGFRGRVVTSREGLWKGRPHKALSYGLARTGGRNSQGQVTVRHRGGGHKRLYRVIDFKRSGEGASGTVERIEYDPNRSARIALIKHSPEGLGGRLPFSYMLAPQSVAAGDAVACGPGAPIRPGNSLPLAAIPLGTTIHNVEMRPGRGGQIARAAGTSAVLISREEGHMGYAVVKMPSGEQRRVLARCTATIGALSNPQHKNRKLGKAGASRWLGRRPHVRGVAMNSVDHPHGGGRGKSKGRISQTPWGVPTKGYKTRKPRRPTDAFIHLSRHKLGKGAV